MAILKSIPYAEYALIPTTYNLPRAIEPMKTGTMVAFVNDLDGQTDVVAYRNPTDAIAGMLMADTFAYGVALIAARVENGIVKDVWIVDGE